MLRVARLTDRRGTYYLATLGNERSPRELAGRSAPDAPGRWVGRGAERLGLRRGVDPAALAAVLGGAHPVNGRPLRTRQGTVAGYDLTFAAPKSVSVAVALGDARWSKEVVDAHDTAVAAGLGYLSARGATVRRRDGGTSTVLPVDGLVAASFAHATSRAGDPHLHTHVVVANLAHGADGRWSALDGRGIVAHARAAGALYDAVLRHEVAARTGLAWTRRRGGGLELAVVDTTVIGVFSARRAEILEHAGIDASGARRRIAWALTRDPKGACAPEAASLRAEWHRRARSAGVEHAVAAGVLGGRAPGEEPARPTLDERRFAAALGGTFHGGVTRRQAVAAWADALEQGADRVAIERCVEEIGPWGHEVGVSERQRPPRQVIPSPHVLRVLGPRPCEPSRLSTWLEAARTLDHYRSRWPGERAHLASSADMARMPASQLAAYLQTARTVDDVLRRLGRTPDSRRRAEIGLERTPGRAGAGIATGRDR